MHTKPILIILCLFALEFKNSYGIPVKFGPCIGMDCLHGVLMHNDKQSNMDHKVDDIAKRLPSPPIERGPCEGMDCLHGVLMHGDNKSGTKHKDEDNKIRQPSDPVERGPCKGMDCLHGVLMHGDDKTGKDHTNDDTKKQLSKSVERGPCQGMDCLHGVLMHGDEKQGVNHEENIDNTAEVNSIQQNNHPKRGPCQGMDCLHGVLMHGDEKVGKGHNDDHVELKHGKEAKNDNSVKKGPCVGMDCLHGVLMHGDKGPGQDHHHDPTTAGVDLTKPLPGDKDDYLRWQQNHDSKERQQVLKQRKEGFSFGYISDTFLDNIEMLKTRWLGNFFGGGQAESEEKNKDKNDKVNDAELRAKTANGHALKFQGNVENANVQNGAHVHEMRILEDVETSHKTSRSLKETKETFRKNPPHDEP